MTTRIVHYSFVGELRIEANTDAEALRKFEQVSAIDLAAYAADSLHVHEVTVEGKQHEGLSCLKASDMVRI